MLTEDDFYRIAGECGLPLDDLAVPIDELVEQHGELSWSLTLLRCETLIGVSFPEALLESLDTPAELLGFLQVRSS
jgi:hypothetical protein